MRVRGGAEFQTISQELPSLLIIDDSDEVVEFITELFSDEYSCITATDGLEGIAKAEEVKPDIILCDVRMPKMSGLEVVRALKNNPQTRLTPVILLSGYNTRENRLEGLRAMADDFLAKPFDSEELRIKMSNLLQIRKDIQNNEHQDSLHRELGLDATNYNLKERELLENMVDYFIIHYSDRQMGVGNIANHMGISIRQLQRKIKSTTAISPMDLLRIFRLKQSSQLLLRHKSIAEVSEACGFRSPNYFCTCFKEYYQVTPSYYQKNN